MFKSPSFLGVSDAASESDAPLAAQYRTIIAIDPGGRHEFLISVEDSLVRHQTSGRIGSLQIDGIEFKVLWDKGAIQTYILTKGVLIHENMVPHLSGSDRAPSMGVGPQVFVISLKRTPERRAIFSALNVDLRYEFFDAVDGDTVDPAQLIASGLIEGPLNYTKGAIGAALSHLALWERSIESRLPLTIVEDDAVLRDDFLSMSGAVLQTLQADWDLVMWGWNLDSIAVVDLMPGTTPFVMQTDQNALRERIGRFRSLTNPAMPLPLVRSFGLCGYTISPSGARKFRNACFPLVSLTVDFPLVNPAKENNGLDIVMNRIYPLTNSFLSIPPIIVTPNFNHESLTLPRFMHQH
jgi:glycosyl transferase, family 25